MPKNPTLDYLQGAIFRYLEHGQEPLKSKKTCFGLWESDNSTCDMCDHAEACFKLALGLDKDSYDRRLRIHEKL